MLLQGVTVVVGAQWGDEGKGKITHYLAESADLVARYAGGNNAGHTVVIGENKFRLHHIPSGVFFPEKICILGNGMVIDLEVLLQELENLRAKGIPAENIRISDRAHLVMPYHRYIDISQEASRGDRKLGTTGRGIGPAYVDKVARSGIHVGDLLEPDLFREKLRHNFREKAAALVKSDLKMEEIEQRFLEYGKILQPYIADTSAILFRAAKDGKNILLEGAQGTLLDLDFGTYPYVTSSNTIAGNSCTGTGIPPYMVNEIIGISKAYTTRVGTGPFPTELLDAPGLHIREKGQEYGTTTGRPRRCGWLDLVALRYAVRLNGIKTLAIMKLDVLTGIKNLKIAIAYRHGKDSLYEFPTSPRVLSSCEPDYLELPGWDQEISSCRRLEELPDAARKYLEKVQELIEVRIGLISVGPERNQTIEPE